MISTACISGSCLSEDQFRLDETNENIDVNKVFDVLNGNLAAYRIRNFLTNDCCRQIVNNFWESSAKVPRYGYGENGVEGYFIGASHIEKSTLQYLEDALAFEPAVNALFVDSINPLTKFNDLLVTGKEEKVQVRAAKFNGLQAGSAKAIYWNNIGEFLLNPHEDLAQTRDPLQKGFEIQQANRIMAVNFYASVPEGSGQLKIWNIDPDDTARKVLDLTYSGFPYPAELLEDFSSMIIPVTTGDLCIINGNLIHAVLRGNPNALTKDRLLITFFMGFNDNKELIWWT